MCTAKLKVVAVLVGRLNNPVVNMVYPEQDFIGYTKVFNYAVLNQVTDTIISTVGEGLNAIGIVLKSTVTTCLSLIKNMSYYEEKAIPL